MAKEYTTKFQREVLEQIGIPHVKGRTREEANDLIKPAIECGDLPLNSIDPPTEKQINFLHTHKVNFQSDITSSEASHLIGLKIDELNSNDPITKGQISYITELRGKASSKMNKLQAGQFIDYLQDLLQCKNCAWRYHPGIRRCPECGAYLPQLNSIVFPPPHIYSPKGFFEKLFWK